MEMRVGVTVMAVAAFAAVASAPTAPATVAGEVVAKIKTPGFPGPVGAAFGSVWVGGHRNGVVYRIDARSNRVAAKVEVPDTLCSGPAFGSGAIWWPNCGEGGSYVYRIDPRSMRVVGRRTGFHPTYGAGSLWLASGPPGSGGALLRIDPRTGRTLARIAKLGFDKQDVFFVAGFGFGSAWVFSETGVVARISTATNKITALIAAPGAERAGAFAGGYLFGGYFGVAGGFGWLTNPAGVYRLDPKSNTAKLVKLPIRPFTQYADIALAAGDGELWIRTDDRTVIRLDPRTRKIERKYPASGGGGGIAYASGALWVANAYADSVWRIRAR